MVATTMLIRTEVEIQAQDGGIAGFEEREAVELFMEGRLKSSRRFGHAESVASRMPVNRSENRHTLRRGSRQPVADRLPQAVGMRDL